MHDFDSKSIRRIAWVAAFFDFLYQKRTFSSVLSCSLLLVALLFAFKLKREALPSIDLDIYKVSVFYPGASPREVEQNAIDHIERILSLMPGIQSYSSSSSQNYGEIVIEVEEGIENPEKLSNEIYRKLTVANIPEITPDVQKIIVNRLSTAEIPIYRFALMPSSKGKSAQEGMYREEEKLLEELQSISGISRISTSPSAEQYIEIGVDLPSMQKHQLDLISIVKRLENRNDRTTIGRLETVGNYRGIITLNEYHEIDDLGNTPLYSPSAKKHIFLKDVAVIRPHLVRSDSYERVNQQTAKVIEIYKTPNADILETVSAVENTLMAKSSILESRGLTYLEISNEAEKVHAVNKTLIYSGLMGFVLIWLILFIFLDFHTAFWTAASLPFCLLLTLGYMGYMEISLNYITLTAMITVVGMLVDHGIVISESIHSKRVRGMRALDACKEGLMQVFWPVSITVATTIAAFLPLFLVGGRSGHFAALFPTVITAMLVISFFEACFVLVSHFLHRRPINLNKRLLHNKNYLNKQMRYGFLLPVIEGYQASLRWVIHYRWWAVSLLLTILIFGIYTIAVPSIKKFSLFLNDDISILQVKYLGKKDIPLAQLSEISKRLEKKILEISPDGQLQAMRNFGSIRENHAASGQIYLYLSAKKNWSLSLTEYIELLSLHLLPFGENTASDHHEPDINLAHDGHLQPALFANVAVSHLGGAGVSGKAISLRLYSKDLDDLLAIEKDAVSALQSIRGVQGIESSHLGAGEQIGVKIDHLKMEAHGVDRSLVNRTLQMAFIGVERPVSSMNGAFNSYLLRLSKRDRTSMESILSLKVVNHSGKLISLSQFASIQIESSVPVIHHYNGKNVLHVTANIILNDSNITATTVNQKFLEIFDSSLQEYPRISFDLSGGESEQTNKFTADVIPAFILSSILVLLLLILLFDSIAQPAIILGSVLFSLLGGLYALILHNITLGFMAILGFMGLIGVVVNDSIVMVDFINTLVRSYPNAKPKSLIPLIIKGAGQRFRPIILTTLTTILGLIPTMYSFSGDATFVQPTLIVLAYGLLSGTLITLIFLPAIYMIYLEMRPSCALFLQEKC